MRPFVELDIDTARAIDGVVFDLDDTLTRDGVLEEEAYAALFALKRAGLARIAVTGRPSGWAEVLAMLCPIDLIVCENGAGWWWRDGKAPRNGSFETDLEIHEESFHRTYALLKLVHERMPDIAPSKDTPQRAYDVAFDVGETRSVPPERIRELVALIEREGFRSMVSTVHVHAIPGAWDKASGTVRAASSVLAIDEERLRSRYLFVGDSGNDAAAFAFFEHTAGVANVEAHLASLPVAPRWVASADRGRGFEEIVSALIAKRVRV